MLRNEMIEKLNQIIITKVKHEVDINTLCDETDLISGLGFDSISLVMLIADIESEFDIQFKDDYLNIKLLSKYGTLKKILSEIINPI